MKLLIWVILLFMVSTVICHAQFEQGNVEISLMGTGGYTKESPSMYSSNAESIGYVLINTCIGYYLVDGLSIEPQIGLLAIEKVPPSQSILLNLSFSTRLPNSDIAIFLRGGYGFSNSISSPLLAYTPIRRRDQWDIRITNLGGGVKFILKEYIALKVEGNYREESFPYELTHYSYSPYGSYDESTEYSTSSFGILIGVSFIL
jgi:hypothetical protein